MTDEHDLVVAGDGNAHWSVVSLGGAFRWYLDDSPAGYGRPAPVVVYSGLESPEAAEMAVQDAALGMSENGSPYGPSEVPISYFNALGRVLRCLRENGVDHPDLFGLTLEVADAADGTRPSDLEDELVF